MLWIAVGVALALCLSLWGVTVAALAARRTMRRLEEVQRSAIVADMKALETQAARINATLVKFSPLMQRANEAIARMNQGLRDLRLPQALAALRTAGAAIKLLLSFR